MTAHIFNPEHDIALATDLANFTAPHAGRQLRHDLGFLPALWADEGDVVLVDDIEQAKAAYQDFCARLAAFKLFRCMEQVSWATSIRQADALSDVQPWGWDRAVHAMLYRRGIDTALLPTDKQLNTIRNLSHRRTAAHLLNELQTAGTIGEAFECCSLDEVKQLATRYGKVVMKAPWSSSGRGIRVFDKSKIFNTNLLSNSIGWMRNIISSQGSIMVEPYYKNIKDFGMEFWSDGHQISYLGLSLFNTINGAYTGNILASEFKKREMLSHYIPVDLLDVIREKIMSSKLLQTYKGPFGIDMMASAQRELHPCLEINLRRTMGHVALSLSPSDDHSVGMMHIDYNQGKYHINLQSL